MVDAALKNRILARMEATPSLTRSQARRRTLGLMGLALISSATLLVLSPGTALAALDARGWRGQGPALALALPLVALALHQAWARGSSMRAGSTLRYGLVVAITPYALMGASLLGGGGPPEPTAGPLAWLWCAATLFVAGLPPLVAAAWLRRDAEPERAGAMGAALGVSSGAAAWLVHGVACRDPSPLSLLLGHVLPLLLLGLVGEVLGSLWMALRPEQTSWEPAPSPPPPPPPRWNRSLPPLS